MHSLGLSNKGNIHKVKIKSQFGLTNVNDVYWVYNYNNFSHFGDLKCGLMFVLYLCSFSYPLIIKCFQLGMNMTITFAWPHLGFQDLRLFSLALVLQFHCCSVCFGKIFYQESFSYTFHFLKKRWNPKTYIKQMDYNALEAFKTFKEYMQEFFYVTKEL